MAEIYNASAEPPAPSSAIDDLSRLVEVDAEQRLRASLSRLRETAERIREEDAARDDELPRWLLAAMERISGAEDAPLLFASLHRRVHSGLLTWEDVYRNPTVSDGGMSLIGEALKEQRPGHLDMSTRLRMERDELD